MANKVITAKQLIAGIRDVYPQSTTQWMGDDPSHCILWVTRTPGDAERVLVLNLDIPGMTREELVDNVLEALED